MKKFFLFATFAFGFLTSFSQTAITTTNVNLRSSDNYSSKELAIIPKDTRIYLLKCANGWCETNFKGELGYVSSNTIRIVSTSTYQKTSIKYYTNSRGNEVQSPTHYNTAPPGATAVCRDGTYSFSQSRRGTCSHHGGVAKWL